MCDTIGDGSDAWIGALKQLPEDLRRCAHCGAPGANHIAAALGMANAPGMHSHALVCRDTHCEAGVLANMHAAPLQPHEIEAAIGAFLCNDAAMIDACMADDGGAACRAALQRYHAEGLGSTVLPVEGIMDSLRKLRDSKFGQAVAASAKSAGEAAKIAGAKAQAVAQAAATKARAAAQTAAKTGAGVARRAALAGAVSVMGDARAQGTATAALAGLATAAAPTFDKAVSAFREKTASAKEAAASLRRNIMGALVWNAEGTPLEDALTTNTLDYMNASADTQALSNLLASALREDASLAQFMSPLAINPSRVVVVVPPSDVLNDVAVASLLADGAAKVIRRLSARMTMGVPLGTLGPQRPSATINTASGDTITVTARPGEDGKLRLFADVPLVEELVRERNEVPVRRVVSTANGTLIVL